MTTFTLCVKGMTCGGCERAVAQALKNAEGVAGVGVEIDSLRAAVEDAGFEWSGAA